MSTLSKLLGRLPGGNNTGASSPVPPAGTSAATNPSPTSTSSSGKPILRTDSLQVEQPRVMVSRPGAEPFDPASPPSQRHYEADESLSAARIVRGSNSSSSSSASSSPSDGDNQRSSGTNSPINEDIATRSHTEQSYDEEDVNFYSPSAQNVASPLPAAANMKNGSSNHLRGTAAAAGANSNNSANTSVNYQSSSGGPSPSLEPLNRTASGSSAQHLGMDSGAGAVTMQRSDSTGGSGFTISNQRQSRSGSASSPKVQQLMPHTTPPTAARRMSPNAANSHHVRSMSNGTAGSGVGVGGEGGTSASAAAYYHHGAAANGLMLNHSRGNSGFDEEVAELTTGGVASSNSPAAGSSARAAPRSTGFRHSRRPSSPSTLSTLKDHQDTSTTLSVISSHNTTAVYVDPLDMTDGCGANSSSLLLHGGNGVAVNTNGNTPVSPSRLSPQHHRNLSRNDAPTPADSESTGVTASPYYGSRALLYPHGAGAAGGEAPIVSSATYISYEEFCEHIAGLPRLYREYSSGEGGAVDMSAIAATTNSSTNQTPRSDTMRGGAVSSQTQQQHQEDDAVPSLPPPPPSQFGSVKVLFSSPFGEEEPAVSATAPTSAQTFQSNANDPTNISALESTDNGGRDVNASTTSSHEESVATAFLRQPLTAYCRPNLVTNVPTAALTSTPMMASGSNLASSDLLPSAPAKRSIGSTSGSPQVLSAALTSFAPSSAVPSTFGLHQHYFHKPLPPMPIVAAKTPQRTPRLSEFLSDGGGDGSRSPNEYRTPPEGTVLDDGSAADHGDYDGIPEGLLATEGTALSASFSLAPTNVTTPADYDKAPRSPTDGIVATDKNTTTSPTSASAASPQPQEERKPAIITCIDLTAYHGTMSIAMGDVTGRVDLLEAREPRTVLPNIGALFNKRSGAGVGGGLRGSVMSLAGTLRASMAGGLDRSFNGQAASSVMANAANTGADTASSTSHTVTPNHTARSPTSGMSPSSANGGVSPVSGSLQLSGGEHNDNHGSGVGSSGGVSPSLSVPKITNSHTRTESIEDRDFTAAGLRSSCAVSSARGIGSRSATTSALTTTPPASGRPSRFVKKCSHQAFVEEFDCRKSSTIDHQLRCVKFLPANRSPGVTSYLAANEKTIKLFRIRDEQFQHANNSQHSNLIHIRRRDSSLVSGDNSARGIFSTTSPTGGATGSGPSSENGIFANNGDYFPVTPRQRFNKRIVMPVKAFTNVHQYNIQSLSLSADNETFLSLDDLQVFWWHLDAQDTTKATKLADLKPENGQPDILLTAASFHPQHGSLFLVSNSNGVCEIGDLRDPPCRKQREYPISLQVKPELHNTVFHAEHNDILSAISAASFMGKDFVVTRDYLSLKMWDMRYPTNPVASCPVMDFLAPTMDFLYDEDYIFDRFPLAVDDQSLTVATGLYAGTVAVWRPGREASNSSTYQGLRRGQFSGPSGDQNVFEFDEVEFFTATESTKVPDEYGVASQVALGQTCLNDVIKRIIVGNEADEDDLPAKGRRRSSNEPLGDEDYVSEHGGEEAEEDEEEAEKVYPRVRKQAHTNRVTNVAISQGGDRIAFTTNDHLFTFTRR